MNYTHKIIRLYQVLKYFFAFFVSRFYKRENIWLLAERGTDARDNSYRFFLYLVEKCKDVRPYYVISNESPDISRFNKYKESLVEYGSFRHYVLYSRANVLISTHIHGYAPVPSLFLKLDKYFHINDTKYTVMLQHGITKDYIPALTYPNTKLDLIVCGAKPEYEFMKAEFGYPSENIQYLGFCRFDELQQRCETEKIILLMPTWRSWLLSRDIEFSEYFKKYIELIFSPELLSLLRDTGYKLCFYPHHEVQPYINKFMSYNECDVLIIADKFHYDVQDLLKRSALLITDYSSVFFDFVYMKKPVIFYQFDKEQYRAFHYSEGYFNYDDGFGPVVSSVSEVITQIKYLLDRSCFIDLKYASRIDEYFPLNDKANCERTYNYIKRQMKHKLK